MTATTPASSPWALGDFHVIGAANTLVGELLCEDCSLGASHRVLDVACGSGNTALAAARRGNTVTGMDLVDKLIERARIRAKAEGFDIDFQTGNCEQLPFADGSFDYVFSTFGVMFAPDQERAANELLRVCKPGGTIGLANWTVESLPGAMFALSSKYAPPPAGMRAPIEWGTVPGLQRLFGDRVVQTRVVDRCVYARFAGAADWLATFKRYFGPIVMLFERVPPEQHPAVEEELRQIALRYNRAVDGTLTAAMTYINVIMTKQ
jgi:SAM-dependent methyltransferase